LFRKTPLKAQNRYVFFGPLLATPMLLTTHCNFFCEESSKCITFSCNAVYNPLTVDYSWGHQPAVRLLVPTLSFRPRK